MIIVLSETKMTSRNMVYGTKYIPVYTPSALFVFDIQKEEENKTVLLRSSIHECTERMLRRRKLFYKVNKRSVSFKLKINFCLLEIMRMNFSFTTCGCSFNRSNRTNIFFFLIFQFHCHTLPCWIISCAYSSSVSNACYASSTNIFPFSEVKWKKINNKYTGKQRNLFYTVLNCLLYSSMTIIII